MRPKLNYSHLKGNTSFTKDEIRWAIDQCERQGEGVSAVLPFLEGWEYARQKFIDPNKPMIMGGLIDEIKYLSMIVTNGRHSMSNPYRLTPVVFNNGNEATPPQHIPRTFHKLCVSGLFVEDIHAFVIEYLKIHPLEDGNGRVANILLNRQNEQAMNERKGFIYENPKLDGWIDSVLTA